MTHFDEGKGYEGIRTIKIFEFENRRSDIKKCCSHWEKRKTVCQTYQPGHLPTKVTPVIDLTDEPVIENNL